MAVAGKSKPSEIFEPIPAKIISSTYELDVLKSLTYHTISGNNVVTLDIGEVLDRVTNHSDLVPPLRIGDGPENPVLRIPAGKLCCPCLIPTEIERNNTIITRIKFSDGLELNTLDAVMLQDSAGIFLEGLQLIHPVDGRPYFRAPANSTTSDNFESLPEF